MSLSEAPDILAALEASPSRGERRCKVQRILDAVPDDAPGKDRLLHATECVNRNDDEYRSHKAMSVVFARMGTPASDGAIQHHRRHECICYR